MGPLGANTPPGLSHSLPTSATYSEVTTRTRAPSLGSDYSDGYDFNQPHIHDHFESYQPQIFSPPYDPNMQYPIYPETPYEVDIKTERQMYVNDVPTRRDSSTSTFSTYQPPPPHTALPSFPEEEWVHDNVYETTNMYQPEEGIDFDFFDFSHGTRQASKQEALIQVDEADRPLLNHFIDNVLRLIFPILEINQHGSARSQVVLPALESNKCYLHCCLSIAAIHLKSTQGIQNEVIDADIVRHRYATIAELCASLNSDTDHEKILEATLGMIFFQCSVGRPDDTLPDIPWHQHFQAGSSLVRKLGLHLSWMPGDHGKGHTPFNMTLTTWIDILGATMLGQSPQFAATYRDRNFANAPSGLCELMGCEDNIMYLICEIACLDALQNQGGVDDVGLCQMVGVLGKGLDETEPAPGTLEYPYSSTNALRPNQLSRNMTAVFRMAARIYLCSLVPGSSKYDLSMLDLVAKLASILEIIPMGPDGFDRSIVWPLLIGGSMSTPESPFRAALANRVAHLGEHAEFGSFGRMVCLLQEVWRQSDGQGEGTSQDVHWRDVMQQKGWDFLLI